MSFLILAIPCHADLNFFLNFSKFPPNYLFQWLCCACLPVSTGFHKQWSDYYMTAPPQCHIFNFLLSAIPTEHAHFLGESHISADKFNPSRKEWNFLDNSWFLEHHFCWKVPRLHIFVLLRVALKRRRKKLNTEHWWRDTDGIPNESEKALCQGHCVNH